MEEEVILGWPDCKAALLRGFELEVVCMDVSIRFSDYLHREVF